MNLVWECILPLKLVSEANSSEHWTKKSKRHQNQKKWIKLVYLRDRPILPKGKTVILLSRIAPRSLDADDNLPMSFKYVKDYIADLLRPGLAAGRADDDKNLTWSYSQETGKPREYAVKIQIFEVT